MSYVLCLFCCVTQQTCLLCDTVSRSNGAIYVLADADGRYSYNLKYICIHMYIYTYVVSI